MQYLKKIDLRKGKNNGWMDRRMDGESDLGGVQVSGVLHGFGIVAIVSILDDWIKQFSEHL